MPHDHHHGYQPGEHSVRRAGSVAGIIGIALLIGMGPQAWSATIFSCTAGITSLNFGAYDPLSGNGNAATATVTVTCTATGTGSTTVTGTLTLSTGASGSYTPRYMVSGANKLDYNIYATPAYTQIIGNGTGGTYAPSESGTVTAGQLYQVTLPLYGFAPASQNVAPGTYSDTIVATVTY
jgi:spore coat protein U-like protein